MFSRFPDQLQIKTEVVQGGNLQAGDFAGNKQMPQIGF